MKKLYTFIAALTVLTGSLLLFGPSLQAACAPATNLGSATIAQNVSTTGTYNVWTRLNIPDTNNNSVLLEIDGGTCYTVTSAGVNSWTWVKTPNVALATGTRTFKIMGNKPGVKVDRVIATGDLNCVPSNTKDANGAVGTNCANPPDTFVPTVAITAPSSGATLKSGDTVSADASDDTGGSGIAKVEFLVGGQVIATDTSSPYSQVVDLSNVTNGSATFIAKAYDVAGNTAESNIQIIVQNATADTENPSVPTCFSATATAYNSVFVDWCASNDNVGVEGYVVYRKTGANGSYTHLAQETRTSHTDTTVTANTTYVYRMVAVDATGNVSGYTSEKSVTTPAIPDTQAPTAPSGLAVTQTGDSQVTVSWQASTDNVGVKEYEVYRSSTGSAATLVATISSLSWGNTGLSANVSYNYYVIAVDAAGNKSAQSEVKSILLVPPAPTYTGRIVGRITDVSTKGPIPGSYALISVNGAQKIYTVGPNGYFGTEGIPAGNYTVYLRAPGYIGKSKSATVVDGQTFSVKNTFLKKSN